MFKILDYTRINKFIRIFFGDATNIHLIAFFKHMTLKKFINFITISFELLFRKTKLHGKPYTLTIDPNNICNLNCKYCPTGQGNSLGREKRFMTFKEFKKVFDTLKDNIFILHLYVWGEPFLNPDIFTMIKYAKKSNVFVSISTNLNLPNDKMLKIVNSGLDHLIIGIDGYNQKTYSRYRKNGSLVKVINNINTLNDIKNKLSRKNPILQGQFLVFKSNLNLVKRMKIFSESLPLDQFDFLSGGWNEKDEIYGGPFEERDTLRIKRCKYPWIKFLVYSDGGVGSCCFVHNKSEDMGNIFKDSFENIWNSKKFIDVRKYINHNNHNLKVSCRFCHRLIK